MSWKIDTISNEYPRAWMGFSILHSGRIKTQRLAGIRERRRTEKRNSEKIGTNESFSHLTSNKEKLTTK